MQIQLTLSESIFFSMTGLTQYAESDIGSIIHSIQIIPQTQLIREGGQGP